MACNKKTEWPVFKSKPGRIIIVIAVVPALKDSC